jgi:nitrite reductase/ring-hydroxylating ferredoxin subunit
VKHSKLPGVQVSIPTRLRFLSPRERLGWSTAASAVLFLGIAFIVLFQMLLPRPHQLQLHRAAAVVNQITADRPFYVPTDQIDGTGIYLVQTERGLRAVSDQPSHPRAAAVRWSLHDRLFIDPALGCVFEHDGTYRRGPCVRDLTSYPLRVEDDTLIIDIGHPQVGQLHP